MYPPELLNIARLERLQRSENKPGWSLVSLRAYLPDLA